jgi:hypothetical protein
VLPRWSVVDEMSGMTTSVNLGSAGSGVKFGEVAATPALSRPAPRRKLRRLESVMAGKPLAGRQRRQNVR